jgi:prolyl-tRNA synthetase
MKYTDLKIQTQREFPNNARTPGFGWLARAGYVNRENQLLPLGERAIAHLQDLSAKPDFLSLLSLRTVASDHETFFPVSTGNLEVAHCESCKYTERMELAKFKKTPLPREEELPLEKVFTPDCHTIEALASFLNISKEKTAKALMYTRAADDKFVFVVVRGDMTLSEAKLRNAVGEVKLADTESIRKSGAEAGFASPIGLKDALIAVDDLIPQSQNLVAGANEAEYHLKNTNCGRDYTADIVADLALAEEGSECANCGNALTRQKCIPLASQSEFDFKNMLLALAEMHHDDKGLTLPSPASPFDVYLMHIPGKNLDTAEKAAEIYAVFQNAGVSVLFDDRDERAGVKFNDADLIGCPMRVTVGEKGLKDGMVELKPRKEREYQLVPLDSLVSHLQHLLA